MTFAIFAIGLAFGTECKHDDTNFRCIKYLSNYDGDTITFYIPGVHPLLGQQIPVRVAGLDTPEIRTKNKCEKELGTIARDKVTAILKTAKRIDLVNVKRGKYFRIVADVIVDGKSLSARLFKEKLAYQYDGGRKAKVNWCERVPASK